MNPPLNLTFVYYPEDEEEGVVVAEVQSPVIPRIGETLMLDADEAATKGVTNSWEVIDVLYELPKAGEGVLSKITVYIDPSEEDGEEL